MVLRTSQILGNEHKNILTVVGMLEKECFAVESGKSVDAALFRKAVDFIKNYADKFHHAKEEDILFTELVHAYPGPVNQMLHEHQLGRQYIGNLEEGIDAMDTQKVIENSRAYSYLIRPHIMKEDNVLYPLADRFLEQEVEDSMLERFTKVAQQQDVSKYLAFVKEFS